MFLSIYLNFASYRSFISSLKTSETLVYLNCDNLIGSYCFLFQVGDRYLLDLQWESHMQQWNVE